MNEFEESAVTVWHEENLLIDGKLVPAEGGKTYDNFSPFTEEKIGVAADASLNDAKAAIAAARRAFDETDWSTNKELRLKCLRDFHAGLLANLENLRGMVVAEVGAPVQITGMAALQSPIDSIPYFIGLLESYDFTEDLGTVDFMGSPHRRLVEKEPVGVVAAIVAYNYPIQLALAKMIPALAAGCTVILKGAPQTPWSALSIGKIAAEAGFPAGVVNVITSSSVEVSAEFTTSKDIDAVSFTGSTPVGKKIMAASSNTVKRVFLELGGKSAMVCLEDGDIPTAAMIGVYATTSHSGQGCAITSRLVVPRARLDETVELVKQFMGGIKVGDPADPETNMGPLITKDQQNKVKGYVDRAVAAGGTLVVGGGIPADLPTGYFFEPTAIVTDENSELAQEELFGPVLAIIPHDGDDDAIRIANNSDFGLSGGIMSADLERGLAAARRVRTGTIGVNGGVWFAPDAPFGGYKQSGFGRENGVPGFEEFLETKTLAYPEPTAS